MDPLGPTNSLVNAAMFLAVLPVVSLALVCGWVAVCDWLRGRRTKETVR